jgi:hypothetical protein
MIVDVSNDWLMDVWSNSLHQCPNIGDEAIDGRFEFCGWLAIIDRLLRSCGRIAIVAVVMVVVVWSDDVLYSGLKEIDRDRVVSGVESLVANHVVRMSKDLI